MTLRAYVDANVKNVAIMQDLTALIKELLGVGAFYSVIILRIIL